jgi:hypothetical protein
MGKKFFFSKEDSAKHLENSLQELSKEKLGKIKGGSHSKIVVPHIKVYAESTRPS